MHIISYMRKLYTASLDRCMMNARALVYPLIYSFNCPDCRDPMLLPKSDRNASIKTNCVRPPLPLIITHLQ